MKTSFRILCLLLALVAFACMAMGSGSDEGEQKEIEKAEGGETDAEQSGGEQGSDKITIEEQVLFEKEGLKVTATEYTTDSIWGDGIKLLIENGADKDYGLGCKALIVNNYMINDLFSATVAAGKNANETLYFSSSELKAAGIENVGQIEIYFHVFDSDSYHTLFDLDCITIKTSAFDKMDTTPGDVGVELYNAGGIRIVGKYVNEDTVWGTAVLLYLENNSGKNIGVSCNDMSINGFMVNPLFSSTVYDGKMAIDEVTIFSNQLEENGIESVEELELKFRIFDAETYSTIAESDPIAFSVKNK